MRDSFCALCLLNCCSVRFWVVFFACRALGLRLCWLRKRLQSVCSGVKTASKPLVQTLQNDGWRTLFCWRRPVFVVVLCYEDDFAFVYGFVGAELFVEKGFVLRVRFCIGRFCTARVRLVLFTSEGCYFSVRANILFVVSSFPFLFVCVVSLCVVSLCVCLDVSDKTKTPVANHRGSNIVVDFSTPPQPRLATELEKFLQ